MTQRPETAQQSVTMGDRVIRALVQLLDEVAISEPWWIPGCDAQRVLTQTQLDGNWYIGFYMNGLYCEAQGVPPFNAGRYGIHVSLMYCNWGGSDREEFERRLNDICRSYCCGQAPRGQFLKFWMRSSSPTQVLIWVAETGERQWRVGDLVELFYLLRKEVLAKRGDGVEYNIEDMAWPRLFDDGSYAPGLRVATRHPAPQGTGRRLHAWMAEHALEVASRRSGRAMPVRNFQGARPATPERA